MNDKGIKLADGLNTVDYTGKFYGTLEQGLRPLPVNNGVKLAPGVVRFANGLEFRAYVTCPLYPLWTITTDLEWVGRYWETISPLGAPRVRCLEMRWGSPTPLATGYKERE